MKKVNLHETKTDLSKLEDIVPSSEDGSDQLEKKTRKSGAWAGKGKISKDFDKLPNDFMKFFED